MLKTIILLYLSIYLIDARFFSRVGPSVRVGSAPKMSVSPRMSAASQTLRSTAGITLPRAAMARAAAYDLATAMKNNPYETATAILGASSLGYLLRDIVDALLSNPGYCRLTKKKKIISRIG